MIDRQSPGTGRRQRHARSFAVRCIALMMLCGVPALATAIVCPFTNYMPNGEHPVGHATQWHAATEDQPTRHVQWWYPAGAQTTQYAGNHTYGDYQRELQQSGPVRGGRDPVLTQRMRVLADDAQNRGTQSIKFSHMLAANMLALRDALPLPGEWPLIWLAGDAAFADQLASQGFIVVSTPVVYGTEPTIEQRVRAAQLAIDETRSRYNLRQRKIGFVGFDEQAVLAARLSGTQSQTSALALIGDWAALDADNARRGEARWFDPAEITSPTLYIHTGDTYAALKKHPLGSPFSATTQMYIGGLRNAHLQFGIQESCAPRLVDDTPISPLMLTLTQHALRLKLAQFFAEHTGVAIKPAPLKLLPFDERRRPAIDVRETEIAASLPAPPSPEEIAARLAKGGVAALLAPMSAATRQAAPTSWWELVIAQLHITDAADQTAALLDAWQSSQPNSLAAAVHRAAMNTGEAAKADWKKARALVRKDQRIAPLRRQQLIEAIEAGLKAE